MTLKKIQILELIIILKLTDLWLVQSQRICFNWPAIWITDAIVLLEIH